MRTRTNLGSTVSHSTPCCVSLENPGKFLKFYLFLAGTMSTYYEAYFVLIRLTWSLNKLFMNDPAFLYCNNLHQRLLYQPVNVSGPFFWHLYSYHEILLHNSFIATSKVHPFQMIIFDNCISRQEEPGKLFRGFSIFQLGIN